MARSRIASGLALGAFCLGVPAAFAQNVRTMGSLVQEPTTSTPIVPGVPVPPEVPGGDQKSSRPAPNELREAPSSSVAPAATVTFGSNSADISDQAKADLDRVARTISQQRLSQIELRAFAVGDPAEARRVALARALAVRSYLIDQGVTARIEVGAFSAHAARSGERVEVLAPGP